MRSFLAEQRQARKLAAMAVSGSAWLCTLSGPELDACPTAHQLTCAMGESLGESDGFKLSAPGQEPERNHSQTRTSKPSQQQESTPNWASIGSLSQTGK